MMSRVQAAALAIALGFSLFSHAQAKKLTMSGVVTDKESRKPIEGATVTVVGNKANQETTDGEGAFILTFVEGVQEGDPIRVRVEKTGYRIYEALKPVSSTIPLQVSLEATSPSPKSKPDNITKQTPTEELGKGTAHPDTVARPDHKTNGRPSTETQQPTQPLIIQTGPTFGNLADRANALSDQIMEDLYLHGWYRRDRSRQERVLVQQMPTKPEEREQWVRSRSSYFRFRFFEQVLDLRNEFAQLHLRDERLDDFFKYQGMIEQANRQMALVNAGHNIDAPILPQQIEEVAERLKILANQIPTQRAAPRQLPFSVTRVMPEKPEFSFEIVVTINTDADVSAGYIVVEFEGVKASIGTDFVDSKLVFSSDESIVGNKPLKDYLLVHPTDTYALAIGRTPLTPKKPIHVVASGGTPFNVTRVTLFDK
jgi:hypothetical protein